MRSVGLSLGLIVAGLALAACPDTTELPSDDDTGTGGQGGAQTLYADSPCGLCVGEACASQVAACAAEPECASALECLYACPIDATGNADPACEAACPVPTSDGPAGALAALTTCRASGDGASCEACGVVPTGHPLLNQTCGEPVSADACTACEEEHCCETRCNGPCQGYITCMQGCGGEVSCQDGCAAAHVEGVAEFGRWLACQLPHCRDYCQSLIPGPCLECGLVHCADEYADCFGNASCYLRFWCGFNCDSHACYQACDAKYPEANALMGAWLLCVGDNCLGGPCDGGEP